MDDLTLFSELQKRLFSQPLEEENTIFCRPLGFTQKEISKMPTFFRTVFRVAGNIAHIRKREDHRYKCSYEIRFRRNGYNISVSAPTIEQAKARFIAALKTAKPTPKLAGETIPTTFSAFVDFWLEHYYRRKVAASTYKTACNRLKTLKDTFAEQALGKIKTPALQAILDARSDLGQGKTVDELYCFMRQIFLYAVKCEIIKHNPCDLLLHRKHETVHGKALSIDDQNHLLRCAARSPYLLDFAVALYCGLRPNEYYTLSVRDGLIIAKNSKRKNGKVEYKRIPIHPKLAPYMYGVNEIKIHNITTLRRFFAKVLPNFTLYDLRTTFYTYCKVCGVAQAAIDEFVGHSSGILAKTYTDLPDEYLIREGEKLAAWGTDYPQITPNLPPISAKRA